MTTERKRKSDLTTLTCCAQCVNFFVVVGTSKGKTLARVLGTPDAI
jgi:hypothetical protein